MLPVKLLLEKSIVFKLGEVNSGRDPSKMLEFKLSLRRLFNLLMLVGSECIILEGNSMYSIKSHSRNPVSQTKTNNDEIDKNQTNQIDTTKDN